MDEIARRAGVSKYAVSKALSGKSGVSEQTRERIVAVATNMGYFSQPRLQNRVPSVIAVGGEKPRISDKRSVMVLMPNIRMQNMDSHYWGRIVDGISDELKKYNLSMIITTEHSEEGLRELVNLRGVLGVIVVGMSSTALLLGVSKLNLSLVMVDHEDAALDCDTLFVNNFEGSFTLTRQLLFQGHTRLQFVGEPNFAHSFRDRFLGFRAALEDSGVRLMQDSRLLEVSSLVMEDTRRQVRTSMAELMACEEPPTVLVCANDDIALASMAALQDLNVSVPKQVSVTGFDDIDEASHSDPALTTIHVAKEVMGRRAVEMLLRRHGHPDLTVEKVLIAVHPVWRESTSARAHALGQEIKQQ